jgi:hypothetical protein
MIVLNRQENTFHPFQAGIKCPALRNIKNREKPRRPNESVRLLEDCVDVALEERSVLNQVKIRNRVGEGSLDKGSPYLCVLCASALNL